MYKDSKKYLSENKLKIFNRTKNMDFSIFLFKIERAVKTPLFLIDIDNFYYGNLSREFGIK